MAECSRWQSVSSGGVKNHDATLGTNLIKPMPDIADYHVDSFFYDEEPESFYPEEIRLFHRDKEEADLDAQEDFKVYDLPKPQVKK